MKAVINALVYLLVVLAFFLYAGKAITELSGGGRREATASFEVTPEGGRAIFFGKGRCFTCHSMGDEGSSVRGPNLGVFGERFRSPIGIRAIERATERSKQTGLPYSAADYLLESLADPAAYLVEGYKNEMAIVYAPPISLSLDEIRAVILYLQGRGGEPDAALFDKPGDVSKRLLAKIAAAAEAGGGDPEKGALVFDDNCRRCHRLKGEGGLVGPDLSVIGKQEVSYLSASIQRPAEVFFPGYETVVIVRKDGRQFIGIRMRDDQSGVEIRQGDGQTLALPREEIAEVRTDPSRSVMPEDFMDQLTVREYQDLLAFLLLQKGER